MGVEILWYMNIGLFLVELIFVFLIEVSNIGIVILVESMNYGDDNVFEYGIFCVGFIFYG